MKLFFLHLFQENTLYLNTLATYLQAFKKLKRGNTPYGLAPHKPILLLSVLQGFQNKLITQNQISITPELVFLFKANWTALVNTPFVCNFALPFFHLHKEKPKYWHLVPKSGFEVMLSAMESISSFTALNGAVQYATLDEDLFELMKETTSNGILQQFLIDTYFPSTKSNFSNSSGEQKKLFDDLEGKILHEPATAYRAEIKKLIAEQNEEEIFIRGSLFKREIPKIYNNTCCISGMKIDAVINVSMIDACHIVPFAESYDDTITNGIALCPNLHRAFDRGLISIDDDYRVVISNKFKEETSNYGIGIFAGKQINLPANPKFYPSLENFGRHRGRF